MLSDSDIHQLSELHKTVVQIPSNEPSFLRLESIFLDVLSFARLHAGEANENQFLFNLKHIHQKEFHLTQLKYNKAKQRELAIKKFKRLFAKELATYLNLSTTQH